MAILNFKGKTFVQNHHLAVKYHQLVPKKDLSLTDKVSLNDNLIIHGDNLKVLKALLPTYAGKVKCIYIDPPYNTGNEKWVYNDNVNSPMMQEWLGKIVDREDLTRHDKWLCMMMPRLKILRELLAENGSIWISIDDIEVANLRLLLDEIFGPENFIANVLWQKKYAVANDHKTIAPMHDHILVYRKSEAWQRNLLPRTEEKDKQYRFEDIEGDFRISDYTCNKSADERPNLYYAITNPNTGEEIWPKRTRVWAYSLEEHKRHVAEELIYWGKDGKGKMPAFKRYKHLLKNADGIVPTSWWQHDFAGHTDAAKKEIRNIFSDNPDTFDFITPKPTTLIKKILSIASNQNDLILDSFAGSGTTAHAVLDLNKEDGGNRKFILVECEDYADKITAERVRRIIKGVKGAKDEKLKKGLGGSFSFFELGDPIEMKSILEGKKLPSYLDLARYVFYTATGEEFDLKKVNEKKNFIGESREYEAYLFYKPDIEYLKSTALNLELAKKLGEYKGKKRLVFAPAKYLDTDYLLEYRIDYCQLPFEIYKLKGLG